MWEVLDSELKYGRFWILLKYGKFCFLIQFERFWFQLKFERFWFWPLVLDSELKYKRFWFLLKYGRFSWEVMSQLRMRALASGGRNLISVGTDHKEWITAE